MIGLNRSRSQRDTMMGMTAKHLFLVALAAAAIHAGGPAAAHADAAHAAAAHSASVAQPVAAASAPAESRAANAAKAGPRDAASYFTELELLTQDGRKVRFHSDVLQGRTVLINVVYATCQDACPLITQKLNEVRQHLPPELFGKQVFFVSLTSDPTHDTPQALKAFARKQGADVDGWTFLTGRKENVEHILKKLGQYSETVEGHSTLLIAGNVPAKRWSKIRPDAPPAAIAERLSVLATGAGIEAARP